MTLPTPIILPAHAFAVFCCSVGTQSTISALAAAVATDQSVTCKRIRLALIARSRTMSEATASTMTACRVLSQSCRPVHHRTIFLVLPIPKNPRTTPIVEQTMNILRRPHLNLHRSDIIPTSGCTITPENGPAIHTNESVDLGSPKDKR